MGDASPHPYLSYCVISLSPPLTYVYLPCMMGCRISPPLYDLYFCHIHFIHIFELCLSSLYVEMTHFFTSNRPFMVDHVVSYPILFLVFDLCLHSLYIEMPHFFFHIICLVWFIFVSYSFYFPLSCVYLPCMEGCRMFFLPSHMPYIVGSCHVISVSFPFDLCSPSLYDGMPIFPIM